MGKFREFPGSLVVRTQTFGAEGQSSIPGLGTTILQAAQHDQENKMGNLLSGNLIYNTSLSCMSYTLTQ